MALMRIATWNVNGLRARQDFLLHWLARDKKPDVVGLQELKLTDEQFPHLELEAEGYHAVTHGQKSWNGVAILSRERAEVMQRGLPGQDDFGARLITAKVGGIVLFHGLHPQRQDREPRGLSQEARVARALAQHLAKQPRAVGAGRAVRRLQRRAGSHRLAGTRRRTRGTSFTPTTSGSASRALLDWGYVDLFRERYPEQQAFSWWDYRGGAFHKKQGLRIDFVLGTRAIARARLGRRDRSRLPQEEGRADAVGSRTSDRGPGGLTHAPGRHQADPSEPPEDVS